MSPVWIPEHGHDGPPGWPSPPCDDWPVTGQLTAPGLLVHVFLAADQDARVGWQRLRSLWHDVTGALRLDLPVPRVAVPPYLPQEYVAPNDGCCLLAAAERRGTSVWQASAWTDHDILGVTVMTAPSRASDCRRTWADLEYGWTRAMAGRTADEILAEVRIFLAVLAPPSGDDLSAAGAVSGAALGLVRASAPGSSALGWWQHWDTITLDSPGSGPAEALVWEIGPESRDARMMRRLAAVAPARSERQLDHFLWTSGDGAPTPLARHLMHAARLRYQIRVFDDGKPSRLLRDELRLLVDDLCGEPSGESHPAQDGADRGRLRARLEHGHGAALALSGRLDAMRHAVTIINENLRQALSLPQADPAVGPLGEDRQLAAWFAQRLDDELTWLAATTENAGAASRFVAGEAPGRAPARSWTRVNPQNMPLPDFGRRLQPSVVVFTALEVEYEAIRDYLTGPVEQCEERGTLYEIGALPGVRRPWRVAVTQTGPGSTTAGVQLERAMSVFSPGVVLFLGVAGGRKDVARGDVVVADTIYDYEWGKSTLEGYQPRMRTHWPAYRLVQRGAVGGPREPVAAADPAVLPEAPARCLRQADRDRQQGGRARLVDGRAPA